MNRLILILTAMLSATFNPAGAAVPQTRILDLRVDGVAAPINIDEQIPQFSWRMESNVVGQKQTAYRLVVVREEDGSVMWNSDRVFDGASHAVNYGGVSLQPETPYRWDLTVWDKSGYEYRESSHFETGMMDSRLKAWDGAEWIGSKAKRLDAATTILFRIKTGFTITKGDRTSIVFGADDYRLNDPFQNIGNVAGDNYIRIEIDLSGVGTGKGAALNVYRVGYDKGDCPDRPFIVISSEKFPETNINDIFTEENKHSLHTIDVEVAASSIKVSIDDQLLLLKRPYIPENLPDIYRRIATGADAFELDVDLDKLDFGLLYGMIPPKISVNPYGGDGNANPFPALCSIGFASRPGDEAMFSDYAISIEGGSEDPVVFDCNTGNGYSIFADLPGVEVRGSEIIVANQTECDIVSYSDPTYGALTMTRAEFSTVSGKRITKARLYATAMGCYEMFINGTRAGDYWFTPGASQFRETLGYHAYDVTKLLHSGENAIGAVLSGGWFTGYMTHTIGNYNFFGDHEGLLARLVITYDDGSRQILVTDRDFWKVFNDGPVRSGSFFQGERYDANRECATSGWSESGFNDRNWTRPDLIEPREWLDFKIVARHDEPVKVRETRRAVGVSKASSPDKHTYTYDMGVNMVGVPSVKIPAGWLKKGDVVILRYGEQLYPGLPGDKPEYIAKYGKNGRNISGRIYSASYRSAMANDFYIAKDGGEVIIQPSTTWRGYQHIQITIPGSRRPLPLENVAGLVLSSCEYPTGTYHAQTVKPEIGQYVNQLFSNIQRSQLGNFFTIPTDCPQRNERMGWTGDAQVYARSSIYNADSYNFFRQWMRALRDDQGAGSATDVPGGIGSTIPAYSKSRTAAFAPGTTWAAAVCMVPWQLYIQYGNTRIIRENMNAMKAWLEGMDFYDLSEQYPHLSAKTKGLADWLALDSSPPDLVNNAIYIHMMEITAIMADAVGETKYAATLRERRGKAIEEWNALYVDPVTGMTRNQKGETVHTQTSYATPLNFNVFNDGNQKRAAEYLAQLAANPSSKGDKAQQFASWTITTGFSGTPNILPTLSREGKTPEAYRMITCTDLPGWLHPVTRGATSVWERWNAYEMAFDNDDSGMNSFNHFALGAVCEWMYEYQLGITNGYRDGRAGYRDFILQPAAGADYTSLSGSYDSHYGRIESAWTADGKGNMTSYSATVPANTTALLYIPIGDYFTIEAAERFKETDGVRYEGIEMHNNVESAVFRLDSGGYTFSVDGGRAVAVQKKVYVLN